MPEQIPKHAPGCNANLGFIACPDSVARDAFAVHSALLKAARLEPKLRTNPLWCYYSSQAYERFVIAFGGSL